MGFSCGWEFVADNFGATAIAPRVFVSVAHIGYTAVSYRGELYGVEKVIEPPGADLRFIIVNRDVPAWVGIYDGSTNGWAPLTKLYVVGLGVGAGAVTQNPFAIGWGADGAFPAGSQRKRWSTSADTFFVAELHYYVFRSDHCGTASQDSGCASFTAETPPRLVGTLNFGENPVVIGNAQSGGKLVATYLDWIKPYLPTNGVPVQPPKPKTVASVKIEAKP